jgi:hypothetical protein
MRRSVRLRLAWSALVLGALVMACSGVGGSASEASPAASPTQVATSAAPPSAPATATASSTTAATSSPGHSQLPPCKADQLTITLVDSSAAAGTEGAWLQFTDSADPCSMQGWPSLVGVTATGSTTTARDTDSELDFPGISSPPLISLTRGDAAYAAFAGSDTQSGSKPCGPSYKSLRVGPPKGSATVVISAWLPYFNGYLPACAGINVTFVIPASARQ